MKVYTLNYLEAGKTTSVTIGIYSTFENAVTAGEKAFKNITGEKEFYWTEDFGSYVLFDENGGTSNLFIRPEELDTKLM